MSTRRGFDRGSSRRTTTVNRAGQTQQKLSIVRVVGTSSDDTLEGTKGKDVVVALAGGDSEIGYEGNDRLTAGAARDLVDGWEGTGHL